MADKNNSPKSPNVLALEKILADAKKRLSTTPAPSHGGYFITPMGEHSYSAGDVLNAQDARARAEQKRAELDFNGPSNPQEKLDWKLSKLEKDNTDPRYFLTPGEVTLLEDRIARMRAPDKLDINTWRAEREAKL